MYWNLDYNPQVYENYPHYNLVAVGHLKQKYYRLKSVYSLAADSYGIIIMAIYKAPQKLALKSGLNLTMLLSMVSKDNL